MGYAAGTYTSWTYPDTSWVEAGAHEIVPGAGPPMAAIIAYRKIVAGDPTQWTFQFSSGLRALIMALVSDVDLDNPEAHTWGAFAASADDNIVNIPTKTTVDYDVIRFGLGGGRGLGIVGGTAWTPPTGWTEIAEKNTGGLTASNKVSMSMVYKIVPAPVADPLAVMTISNNADTRIGGTWGVRPPPPSKLIDRVGY